MNQKKVITVMIIVVSILLIGKYIIWEVYDYIIVTDGEKLYEAGFVTCGEDGKLNETEVLTKASLIFYITEVNGKKEYAKIYNGLSSYDDVYQDDWFCPYIAYSENEGWLDGQGKFNPMDTVSTKIMEEIVLNQFGYEIKGVNKRMVVDVIGIPVEANDEAAMTKGEIFSVLWYMVNTQKNNSNIEINEMTNNTIVEN